MPDQGDMYIPMFTSSQTVAVGGATEGNGTSARFAEGTAIHYDRWFGIGQEILAAHMTPSLRPHNALSAMFEVTL